MTCHAEELSNYINNELKVLPAIKNSSKAVSLLDSVVAELGRLRESTQGKASAEGNEVNVWFSSGENKELSNLAYRPFSYEGKDFVSVEHAYQSWKSGNFNEGVYNDPRWKSVQEGKAVKVTKGPTKMEGNWNTDALMPEIVKASFDQNTEAKEVLVSLGSKTITHTQDKGVWGKKFPEILNKLKDFYINQSTEEESSESYDMGNGNMSNKGQTKAIDDIKKWLKGSGDKKTYLLAGRGGTGKTSVIATVLKEAGFGVDNVVFATPTNAATEVLKRSNESSMFNKEEHYGTIASLVSKKPARDANNNIKKDKDGDTVFELTDDLGEFRALAVGKTVKVIVVDESSMLVKEDYDALKKYYPNKLIIFMGDVAQLPPIDKKNPSPESEVFIDHLNENYSELEEVMRQGKDSVVNTVNDIVYPSLREVINLRREGYKVEFGEVSEGKIYEVKEGKVVVSGSNLKDLIKDAVRVHDGLDSYLEGDVTRFEDAIVKDLVEQQENAKVIMFNQQMHTNNVSLTNKVRKRYLEGVNKGKVYENGRYSVAGSYVTKYDGVLGMQVNDLLVTNEGINHISEYIVDKGDRIVKKVYKGIGDPPALRIVKGTTGKVLKVGEVKPTFYEKVEMKNMELVSEYVNAGKYGEHQIVTVELNDAKKSVVDFIVPVRAAPGKVQSTYLLTPDIAFGYVNNVHKAQGHTYSTAYVDYDNIHNNFKAARNGDAESFLKAIYVAVSRPRQKLVMKMSGESVYPKGLLDLNNIQKCQG